MGPGFLGDHPPKISVCQASSPSKHGRVLVIEDANLRLVEEVHIRLDSSGEEMPILIVLVKCQPKQKIFHAY
jgi:hypothetical protein